MGNGAWLGNHPQSLRHDLQGAGRGRQGAYRCGQGDLADDGQPLDDQAPDPGHRQGYDRRVQGDDLRKCAAWREGMSVRRLARLGLIVLMSLLPLSIARAAPGACSMRPMSASAKCADLMVMRDAGRVQDVSNDQNVVAGRVSDPNPTSNVNTREAKGCFLNLILCLYIRYNRTLYVFYKQLI